MGYHVRRGALQLYLLYLSFSNSIKTFTEKGFARLGLKQEEEKKENVLKKGIFSVMLEQLVLGLVSLFVMPLFAYGQYIAWFSNNFYEKVILPMKIAQGTFTPKDVLDSLEKEYLVKCKYNNKVKITPILRDRLKRALTSYRADQRSFADVDQEVSLATDSLSAMTGEVAHVDNEIASQKLEESIQYFTKPTRENISESMDIALAGMHQLPMLFIGEPRTGRRI